MRFWFHAPNWVESEAQVVVPSPQMWGRRTWKVALAMSTMAARSSQDFAQKNPGFTLTQEDLCVTVSKQGAEARAHVAGPGMFAPQPHPLHALLRQLNTTRDRPHFLDKTDNPITTQTGACLADQFRAQDNPLGDQRHQQHTHGLAHHAPLRLA